MASRHELVFKNKANKKTYKISSQMNKGTMAKTIDEEEAPWNLDFQ